MQITALPSISSLYWSSLYCSNAPNLSGPVIGCNTLKRFEERIRHDKTKTRSTISDIGILLILFLFHRKLLFFSVAS